MLLSIAIAAEFMLHDGDRVLFYGDSITEQHLYTAYVETFVRTRYPRIKVSFVNAGCGGDATWGGWTGTIEERAKRDVLPHKPTHITVMLGMNDGGYVPYEARVDRIFVEWYGKLLTVLTQAAPGARFTLIQTSPFDDVTGRPSQFAGYNATLLRYGQRVKEMAKRGGHDYVDFNEPVVNALQKAKLDQPKVAEAMVPDMIHPGPAAHLIMAAELLKKWGVTPIVSKVTIDAVSKRVVESDLATVKELRGLSWTQVDPALPYPVDEGTKPADVYADFSRSLNLQTLAIRGLQQGKYELFIDDASTRIRFDAERWSQGVNLADYDTPMRRQAAKVLELVLQRSELYLTKWQKIGHVLVSFKNAKVVTSAMDRLIAEINDKARAVAQPKAHKYELKRVD